MMLFIIAWRNLWRSRLRSWLIIGSVVLGIWSGLFINAMYFGMGKSRVETAVYHEVSHIQVHHPAFGDEKEAVYAMDADSVGRVLAADARIKSFSLRALCSGMAASAAGSRGVQLYGIDPEQEKRTRELDGFVRKGNYLDTAVAHRIYIGERLAKKMKVDVGNKLVLTFMNNTKTLTSAAFRICGLYRTENAPMDEFNVYILRTELEDLLGMSGKIQEAAILLQSDEMLDTTLNDLRALLPALKVESWKEISPETALVMGSLDAFAIVFMVIILLALAFGVINTMLMAVLERSRELGMLMAVGMNRKRVFGMVVLETVLLTLTGLPIGMLAAWATIHWLGKTGMDLHAVAGDSMEMFGYSSVIYPYLPAHNVWQTVLLVAFAALIAAIFPAVKALRLKPVEAIRQ